MNILRQRGAIIERFRPGKDEIRFDAFIDIVEGTVAHSRQLLCSGDHKYRAGSGRTGQHHAGAAAGALTEQRNRACRLKRGGDQVAAGEVCQGDGSADNPLFRKTGEGQRV